MCRKEQDETAADDQTVSTGASQKRKRTRTSQSDDPYDFEYSQPATGASGRSSGKSKQATQSSQPSDSVPMDTIDEEASAEPASISEERFNLFKKSLTQLFRESRAQSLPAARFRDYLREQH